MLDTSTSPGAASDEIRAPIETAIPATFPSCSSHSPVWIPARTSIPSGRTAAAMAVAAWTARAGPSKVAKKPSPAVSSSSPWKRASSRRTRAWCRLSRSAQPASPRRAAVWVDSTISVKRMVASTRLAAAGAESDAMNRLVASMVAACTSSSTQVKRPSNQGSSTSCEPRMRSAAYRARSRCIGLARMRVGTRMAESTSVTSTSMAMR